MEENYVIRLADKINFLRAFSAYGEETQGLKGGGQTAAEFSSLDFRLLRLPLLRLPVSNTGISFVPPIGFPYNLLYLSM